jgi:hypothetical protein
VRGRRETIELDKLHLASLSLKHFTDISEAANPIIIIVIIIERKKLLLNERLPFLFFPSITEQFVCATRTLSPGARTKAMQEFSLLVIEL